MRKKKIKILHVAQAAGGVDRYIRMLLKYLDASHDSWVLLACLACGGNVFFDKKPHILFRRYNTNTSIDGGKLKSRLKYEFRYFEKYKNNRLDTACELLNCYNSNMSVSSKSFLEKVKNYT